MSEKYEGLGKRIENIRLQRSMNKSEFGKMFQANGSLVNKWEKGKVTPNEERLKAISELGGISVDELLYGNYKDYVTSVLYKAIRNNERLQQTLNKYFSYNAIFNFGEEDDGLINAFSFLPDSSEFNYTFKEATDLIDYLIDEIIDFLEASNKSQDPEKIILFAQVIINDHLKRIFNDFNEAIKRIRNFLSQFNINHSTTVFENDSEISDWIDTFARAEDIDREEAKKITLNKMYLENLISDINRFIRHLDNLQDDYQNKIDSDI